MFRPSGGICWSASTCGTNKNVFNQLTVALSMRAAEMHRRSCAGPISAARSISTSKAFSAEFEAFERRRSARRQFNFEFRVGDIMVNFAESAWARDLIQSRGGTVAIDGLAAGDQRHRPGPTPGQYGELFWQPGMVPELMRRQALFDKLRAAAWCWPGGVDEEGLQIGRELKFPACSKASMSTANWRRQFTPPHQPNNHFAA